jgi:hypothetical protein
VGIFHERSKKPGSVHFFFDHSLLRWNQFLKMELK